MSYQEVIKNKYSQNFLKSSTLVDRLIKSKTNINRNDTVIDIGVGKGIITEGLTMYAKKVIGYEIDKDLITNYLQTHDNENVKLLSEDFLKADISKFGDVKVFANIPFFLTADIVRKIILENENVKEAYLFMEKEAFWRFYGKPYKNNSILSVLIRTLYDVKLLHSFNREDFVPAPNAEVILVGFTMKQNSIKYRSLYYDFVSYLFNLRKANLKIALNKLFSYEQTRKLANQNKFQLNDKVSNMEIGQWISIYNYFLTLDKSKHIAIMGEFARIMRHQRKLNNKVIVN
jgi:16S rRNA A1518/A1519 N6-dimethyltransferase RsmA/KsgA/DIM1 with predicted DNA glycosylase/AP lyase activity